jgi:serine-type D-Ala-D-Ala carboxypeptidase (penicillin-binding protein 5/6)
MFGHLRLRGLAASLVAGVLLAGQLALPALASDVTAVTASTAAPARLGPVVGGDLLGAGRILTSLPPGVPAPPVPKAVGWLVADLDSRQIIAGHAVHTPLAPASTMKIFTALALAPRLAPATVYTASEASTAVDGTKIGLVAGSRYTADQLLHGLIMSSGNDCAIALGELAGGQDAAIALMQSTARSLGALDTVVRTTSGLDAPGQASSAYDLALAGSAALKNPQLARLMTTRAFDFPAEGTSLGADRKTFSIQTHNKLIYNTPGATGIKNGYTVAARGSFVGSATRSGRSYIAVVLRAEGSTWHAVDDLLTWAFRYGPQAGPVGRLITPAEAKALQAAGLQAAGPRSTPAVRAAVPEAAGLAAATSGTSLTQTSRVLLAIVLVAGLLLTVTAAGLMLWPQRAPVYASHHHLR